MRAQTWGAWGVRLVCALAIVSLAACEPSEDDKKDTSLAVPGTPTGLSAATTATQNTVTWNAPGSGGAVASYNIYWSHTTGVSTSNTKISSASTPYTHTGTTGGSQYCYRVSGVNATGEGGLSDEVCGTFSVAALTMLSYDDFSSGSFSRRKWNDEERSNKIVSGKLESKVTGWDSNINNNLSGIAPSGGLTSLSAEVTLTAADGTGLGTTNASSPRARITAGFYHDGSLNGGGLDRRGDILASVFLNPTSTTYAVFRCVNPDCSATMNLDTGTLSSGLTVGATRTLSISWTQNTGQFSLSDGVDSANGSVPATFDAATAGAPYAAGVHASGWAVGTQSSGLAWGEFASVAATIDNVMINGSLHDNFSAASIDLTKWRFAGVAEVAGGKATITQESSGAPTSMDLSFRYPDRITAMAADVTVSSYSNGTNGNLRAQLNGMFYNDGTAGDGTGNRNGDVVATIGSTDTDITYAVSTCSNSDCTTLTNHVTQTLGAAITLGSTHRLELAYDGTQFIFRRDGIQAATFTGPASVKEVQGGPFKALRTRTFGNTTGDARIVATFDNVATNAGDSGLVGNADFEDNGSGTTLNTDHWVFFQPEQWAEVGGGVMSAGLITTSFSTSVQPSLNVTTVSAELQADVKITASTIKGGAEGRARIAGEFFLNTSGNHVFAGIYSTATEVRWFVVECQLTDCSINIPLAAGKLGNSSLGVSNTLRLQYNSETIFTFTRGTDIKEIDVGTVSSDVPRAVAYSDTIANPFHAVGVQAQNVGWRESVQVEAEFDNVMVGGVLWDDFDAPDEFDATLWKGERLARTLDNGALYLSSRRTFDATANQQTSSIELRTDDALDFGAERIEATITPTELSVTLVSGNPIAQIVADLVYQPDANFYAGGGNRTNQSTVQVSIRRNGATLQAVAIGLTCLDSSCGTATAATGHLVAFATAPVLNTAYPVVVRRTGTATFNVTFGTETLPLDFGAITAFSAADFKFARLLVMNTNVNQATELASVTATFDNVKVGNY